MNSVTKCYVRTREALTPGKMIPWVRGAHQALELPSGTLARTGTAAGDVVSFEMAAAAR